MLRMLGMFRVLRVLRPVASSAPAIVVPVAARAIGLARRLTAVACVGRRNDADATDVPPREAPPGVVVHWPLSLPRYETVAAGLAGAPIFEDEPRLRLVRPPEHDPSPAVITVRVVPRIVVDHHPEAHARVVVGIPVRPADVAVTVVAEESGVVVVPLDVVRHDVVVPVGVPLGHDALGEVGQRHIGIAAHAPIGDHAVVPVVTALDRIVDEGIGGCDGEEVAHAGVVVDGEGLARRPSLYLELPPTAHVTVVPRLAREQHTHAAVSVDTEDGDVGVAVEPEEGPDALAAGINGGVTPVGPELDAGAVHDGDWGPETRVRTDGQREQREMSEHKTSHAWGIRHGLCHSMVSCNRLPHNHLASWSLGVCVL